MIYFKKYLPIKILIENVCNYPIKGIYRPEAYVTGGRKYCTQCQMEVYKEPIEPGESRVLKAVLFAPHGFGEYLKQGSLLTLRNGINIEAKAVVLEILNS